MGKKKSKNLKLKYINRDISWLSFNERVLQEAEDSRVPINDRIRFLGIFSNNQDELFRVRVAVLRRMMKLEKAQLKQFDSNPGKTLNQIQKKVLLLKNRFDNAYLKILEELKKQKIYILNEKEISVAQGDVIRNYFNETVRQRLFPIMIDNHKKMPLLNDRTIYLAVRLIKKDKPGATRYSLIEVPDIEPSRFFVLPDDGEKQFIILLDDIIRYNLDSIYYIFNYDQIEAYTIKITRDAELDLHPDLSQSVLEIIQKSVKRRTKGETTRFIYDAAMPEEMLQFFAKKMKLQRNDAIIPGARYHNFKDFINFPDLNRKELRYLPLPPVHHPLLNIYSSITSVLRQRDILLNFPYQSFHHINDFLREVAINPNVTSISMTLYRVAKMSSVVLSLINAARNGKHVTVVMELQARFDEENNIFWANKLQEEGVKLLFGDDNLKVHAKLCLVQHTHEGKNISYAIVGTGNFNENTAKVYSDCFLLTSRPEITKEVKKIFEFFDNKFEVGKHKNLMVAPLNMRQRLKQLIVRETKNAKEKKPAKLFFKMNNLVDKEIIKKLYEASMAGVEIKLIVRGICSLVPGVPGLSENIKAISILDRFLEHSRVYCFHNAGKEEIFLGSADLMERNIDFRVEVLVKVLDKEIQKQLKQVLELHWTDNVKARTLAHGHLNEYIGHKKGEPLVQSQVAVYNYFKEIFDQHQDNKNKKTNTESPVPVKI
ncbi:MAG: polyphosphate kinase 1 [Chitinophagales bacterium]